MGYREDKEREAREKFAKKLKMIPWIIGYAGAVVAIGPPSVWLLYKWVLLFASPSVAQGVFICLAIIAFIGALVLLMYWLIEC